MNAGLFFKQNILIDCYNRSIHSLTKSSRQICRLSSSSLSRNSMNNPHNGAKYREDWYSVPQRPYPYFPAYPSLVGQKFYQNSWPGYSFYNSQPYNHDFQGNASLHHSSATTGTPNHHYNMFNQQHQGGSQVVYYPNMSSSSMTLYNQNSTVPYGPYEPTNFTGNDAIDNKHQFQSAESRSFHHNSNVPEYNRSNKPVYNNSNKPVYNNNYMPAYSNHNKPVYNSNSKPVYNNNYKPAYNSNSKPVYQDHYTFLPNQKYQPQSRKYHETRVTAKGAHAFGEKDSKNNASQNQKINQMPNNGPVPIQSKHQMSNEEYHLRVAPADAKLLVLDLNKCLVLRQKRGPVGSQNAKARPYLNEFLDFCFKNFAVMVWSSATPVSVKYMIQGAFSSKQRAKLIACWTRDELGLSKEQYYSKSKNYKKLSLVWSSQKLRNSAKRKGFIAEWNSMNTVIVDDSAEKAKYNRDNLIEVKSFDEEAYERGDDTEMKKLLEYLQDLVGAPNVVDFMKRRPYK